MIRQLLRYGILALTVAAATPAEAQNYRVIGAWRCIAASPTAPIVFDIVFNADGYYSGAYSGAGDFRAYSEGPYRLTGTLLSIIYGVWETAPNPTANPGGETYSVQFRGGEAMTLIPTRCPAGSECRFACDRHR